MIFKANANWRPLVLLFLVFVFATLGATRPLDLIFVLALIGAVAVLLTIGDGTKLFVLGLLYPFQDWRILTPPFHDSALDAFFPHGIDLSVGNFFSLLVLFAFLIQLFLALAARQKPKLNLPLAGTAALFWLASFLSVYNAGDVSQLLSFKYVLYPIIFSYVVFVLLPAGVARRRDDVLSLAQGMFAAGVLAAAMGAASFFTAAGQAAGRATPISIFGVWPLGSNHNLLAETLVATAPLALLFAYRARGRKRMLCLLTAVLMTLIGLLTFARTAWIAFAIMAAVAAIVEYRGALRRHIWQTVAVLLLLLPLGAAFVLFSESRVVQGSTASRVALTNFALFEFSSHPIIGAGAGTFVERLGEAKDFLEDFGDPLDAHGFVQKILAEEGFVGFVLFLLLLGRIVQTFAAGVRAAESPEARKTLLLFSLAAAGLIVYEIFNTTYWSAKLWLPIGLALAALPFWSKEKAPVF